MNAATLNADPSAMYCGRIPLRHLQREIMDAVYAPTCDLDDDPGHTTVIAPDAANFRCYTILQSGQIMYLSHKNDACGNDVTPDADKVRQARFSHQLNDVEPRWVSSKERASSFANYDLLAIHGIFAVVKAYGVPMHAVSDILFVEIIDEDAECPNDTAARNRRRNDPGPRSKAAEGQRQSVSGLVEIIDGPNDTWKQKSDMLEALAHVAKTCIKMMHTVGHHSHKDAANITAARLLEEVAVDAATVVNVVKQAGADLLVIRPEAVPASPVPASPVPANTWPASTAGMPGMLTYELCNEHAATSRPRILGHKFVVFTATVIGGVERRHYLRISGDEIPAGLSDWENVNFVQSKCNATIFDYEAPEVIVDLASLEASPENCDAKLEAAKFRVEPVGDWGEDCMALGGEELITLQSGDFLLDFIGDADRYLGIV